MSNWPLRFVHASDLHLEMLPQGVAEVPDHLRDLFIESAYWAAERVFETVLAEEAEFLVLSGDVLDPRRSGPRGPLFLAEQFARLAERDIAVYWAGGRADPPDAWPSSMPLPENVHRFPRSRIEEFVHERDGTPVIRLSGISHDGQKAPRAADFEADPGGLFSIAVVHGKPDADAMRKQGIHYWALGGRHDRGTLFSSPRVAHYPGSPQGRRPEEEGIHGCTLVQVDDQQRVRTSPVPTDVMRWLSERVQINETTSREDLESDLRERMHSLIEAMSGIDLLISWTIAGTGPLLRKLRRGAMAGELLAWLRKEFGFGPPAAWSLALDVQSADGLPPEYYEHESIRGDYLRALRQFQINPDEPLELGSYMAQTHQEGTLAAMMDVDKPRDRERALDEAALLGVDLLSGEEGRS